MEREIKFRVWLPEEQEMFFSDNQASSDYIECWFIGKSVYVEIQEIVWKEVGGKPTERLQYVKPEQHIMQYTGVKDKNGKEVFEGDVLQDADIPKLFNWLIEFTDGMFTCVNIGVDGYLGERYTISQATSVQRVIIGNKFQNPELLTP